MSQRPDTSLKISDRSAILFGRFGPSMQSVASCLTQMGVNVSLVIPISSALQTKMGNLSKDRINKFADALSDAREINDQFGRAFVQMVDIHQPQGLKDVASKAAEAYGGLDILIDMSLVTQSQSFLEAKPEDWEKSIEENLKAPLMLTHTSMRFLLGKKRGRVIYVIPHLLQTGFPGHALASLLRGGFESFCRGLAADSAHTGVTFNCIAAGATEDFLLMHGRESTPMPSVLQSIKTFAPQAELLDGEKLAHVIAFLVSPFAASINGQTLVAK